ncbi:hypothetical protein [Brachybacterium saurashtrense]|uniref:Uncharacterized protein n=1 Tax=Brachybacterium saurashtrense TaxID=556288 RepID=A0A345YSJ7_9MICO|nr:hypothetical protein [Brachybacterium saurashtrense]AXK46899.1 hypothetical protein DWV08_15600 [Brachybacterium saurashtrense]RRR22614.1 hypothetical protein DXU92_10220 [Brachybacterium saurashtrense]
MTLAAASLPVPGGDGTEGSVPSLDRLRAALRPAQLPLPRPRDVHEAALRAGDLLHAEREREARVLVERFRQEQAPPEDRLELLAVGLRCAALAGRTEEIERDAAALVTLLRRSGHPQQAAAVATVLLERGPFEQPGTGRDRAAQAPQPSSRGRRRGSARQVSPEMLVVVRAQMRSALPGPRGEIVDPRRDAARLRAALSALPAVRDQMLRDPEAELRLRLAQALEGAGDEAGATTAALDVLDLLEDRGAGEGPDAHAAGAHGDGAQDPGPHGAVPAPGTAEGPARLATAAHAVLARTLCTQRPLPAVHHALEALEAMPLIEDPPLRVGLITTLLRGLMAAGATAQAGFTAGRLASLQRTLGRDALRIAPLLAVAAQRVDAQRYDAAWVVLEQARRIARGQRDHRAQLEAARLGASLHERTGDAAASLRELQVLAHHARWLADDLETTAAAQAELIRTELEAQALVMRRALDLGRTGVVSEAVREIERRTRPGASRSGLPPELLWDHRVDARVGLFIAVGTALARGEEGADEQAYDLHRREALEAIGTMPPGHEQRARYWAAYLEDRHAHLLAEQGRRGAARRAAKRAGENWTHLGHEEDAARMEALRASLAAPR